MEATIKAQKLKRRRSRPTDIVADRTWFAIRTVDWYLQGTEAHGKDCNICRLWGLR